MRPVSDHADRPARGGEVGATLPELVVAAALLLGALGLTATVMGALGALQRDAVGAPESYHVHAAADRVARLVRSARASGGEPAVTTEGAALRVRSTMDGASGPTVLRILVRDGALIMEQMGPGASAGASVLLDGLDPLGSGLVALDADGHPVVDGTAAVLVAVDLVHGDVTASRIVRTVDGMGW